MDRAELERLDRESLVLRAQAAGIRRARVLTRPELVDELLRLDPQIDESQLKKTRGFFGRARDLLSRVVERGLHLPDAADRLRAIALGGGNPLPQVPRPEPQAVPTVTLAEIYAAQGHKQRAIETLRRVLEAEPEHGTARALLEKLEAADYVAPKPPLPPENEVEASGEGVDEIGANLGTSPTEPPPPPPPPPVSEVEVEAAVHTPLVDEPITIPKGGAAPLADEAPLSTGTLENPPAPGSSEVTQNECVAIPIGTDGSYVWWRLTHATRRAVEEQRFVVRALVVIPSWDGPKLATRDVACEPIEGELLLRGLPEDAVVRIAVGWLQGNDFVPLAHSPPLAWIRDSRPDSSDSSDNRLVRWTPKGAEQVVLDDPTDKAATSIACAAEGAARAGLHVPLRPE